MARTREIETPSGLCGVVRGLKGNEANILADKIKARKLKTFDEILKNCWQLTDSGGALEEIYIGEGGMPMWEKVLIDDRFYILVQIRIATYREGAEYVFKYQCNNKECGEGQEWMIELDKDMTSKPFNPAVLSAYIENKNEFSSKLPDGTPFKFRLLNGALERDGAKRVKKAKDTLMTTSMAHRIISIEGVEDRFKFITDMEYEDQCDVIDMLDEFGGGYDTDVEVECNECGWEQTKRAPFDEHFWIRPRKKSRSQNYPASQKELSS